MNLPPLPEPLAEETVAPRRRLPWGWAIFALVFGLWILANYAPQQNVGEDKITLAQERILLRSLLNQDALFRKLPPEFESSMAPMIEANRKTTLDQIVSNLEERPTTSLEASEMLVAVTYERSKEPDPKALARLAKSKNPQAQALAAFYSNPKPDTNLASYITGDDPLDKLVRIHVAEARGDTTARASAVSANAALLQFFLWGAFMLFAMLGSVVLVVYVLLRLMGKLEPVGFPRRPISLNSADGLALRMGLYGAVFFAASIAFSLVKGGSLPILATGQLLVVLVAVLFLSRSKLPGDPETPWRLGFGDRRQVGKNVLVGLLVFMANIPIFLTVTLVMSRLFPNLQASHPVAEEITSGKTGPLGIVLLLLTAAVLAPIIEELTFRGMLFPAIARIFERPWAGILGSAFIFAVIHPQGLLLLPALMVVGMGAALAARQTGSLLSAMVMHGFHNAFILVLGLSLAR